MIVFRELPGAMEMFGQQTDRHGFERRAFADLKPGGVQYFSGGIGGQDGKAVEGDDGEEIIRAFVETVVIGHRMIIYVGKEIDHPPEEHRTMWQTVRSKANAPYKMAIW